VFIRSIGPGISRDKCDTYKMQAGSITGNYIMSGTTACSVCWKDDFECDCEREWVGTSEATSECSDDENSEEEEIIFEGDVDSCGEIPGHSYWQHSPFGNYHWPCVVQRVHVSTGPVYRPPWDLPIWSQGEISDPIEQDDCTSDTTSVSAIEIHTTPFTLPILFIGRQ
jgi:hypothetical protein